MYTICLVGRSKVGKTSFLNKIINNNIFTFKLKNSFDFNYCIKIIKDKYFIFIDNIYIYNNILKFKDNINFSNKLYSKFLFNIYSCDIIFFFIDSSIGLLDEDIYFYNNYIKNNISKTILVLNKSDLIDKYNYLNKYFILKKCYSLKIKDIIFISILNNNSLDKLFNKTYIHLENKIGNLKFFNNLLKYCVNLYNYNINNLNFVKDNNLLNYFKINIVILGKTNVGKSTFLNYICGDNRCFVSNLENITKDFIFYNFVKNNIKFLISDSPGINKKFFNFNYSILEFYRIIKFFDIIFFMIDINSGITKYDLYLINFLLIKGKILFIIFNKCENLSIRYINIYKNYILNKYGLMKNLFIFFISCLNLKKKNIFNLFNLCYNCYSNIYLKDIKTSKINKILKLAINNFSENNYFKNVFNLKYAHIGSYKPFTIVIHGNNINNINFSYKKYLINFFTKELGFSSFNINLKFKESLNPYISNRK